MLWTSLYCSLFVITVKIFVLKWLFLNRYYSFTLPLWPGITVIVVTEFWLSRRFDEVIKETKFHFFLQERRLKHLGESCEFSILGVSLEKNSNFFITTIIIVAHFRQLTFFIFSPSLPSSFKFVCTRELGGGRGVRDSGGTGVRPLDWEYDSGTN